MSALNLLFLAVPTVIALLVALFAKRPARLLADWITRSPTAPKSVAALLMVSSGLAALSLDVVDIGDLFPGRHRIDPRPKIEGLKADLQGVHGLAGNHLDSVRRQIEEVYDLSRQAELSPPMTSLFCALAGISGGIYVLTTLVQMQADKTVAEEVNGLRRRLVDAGTQVRTYQQRVVYAKRVFKHVEAVVVRKQQRVLKAAERPIPSSIEARLDVVREALGPEDQMRGFALCAHAFFKLGDRPTSRLVMSIYIPHNGYLEVVASTDGTTDEVITSPNTKYREHFSLLPPRPSSLAVEVFRTRAPTVISRCTRDNFLSFKGEDDSEIRSVFACPLFYSKGPTLGVLFAESNEAGYFPDDEGFKDMLTDMAQQIALRMTFEDAMKALLQKLSPEKGC